jgi:hypothetical protein
MKLDGAGWIHLAQVMTCGELLLTRKTPIFYKIWSISLINVKV